MLEARGTLSGVVQGGSASWGSQIPADLPCTCARHLTLTQQGQPGAKACDNGLTEDHPVQVWHHNVVFSGEKRRSLPSCCHRRISGSLFLHPRVPMRCLRLCPRPDGARTWMGTSKEHVSNASAVTSTVHDQRHRAVEMLPAKKNPTLGATPVTISTKSQGFSEETVLVAPRLSCPAAALALLQ